LGFDTIAQHAGRSLNLENILQGRW